ncbi:MAG: M14 family zinc carboxypeptidase [Streptomycetales bacterium]
MQGLDRIARTSGGLVSVHSAGQSGEGRELLYATVGSGPDRFWLQSRIHGDELHSTEAALQILDHLASGDPQARLIRERMTLTVIAMYNPDGAEANIRQSTTPNRIDLNRDWENFAQPESRQWYEVWEATRPRLALDLHHMSSAPQVEGTDDLNQFQMGARPIDPSRMGDLQWLTARQMSMVSVNALEGYGLVNTARYPEIDITNAVLSRMLLGGPGPDGSDPGFTTQGAVFYEVRSVGQKSNGQLANLFRILTMALLEAVASGDLERTDISGFGALPFAERGPCGDV